MDTHLKCKNIACTLTTKSNSLYCKVHSSIKRCPNCIDWIDSRFGQIKYDRYCATCFKILFPNDTRATKIRSSQYEHKVRDFINLHFQNFVHNNNIYTHACNCTNRRRIDHFTLLGNTVLAIETDEHQHNSYDDEEIRYNDLYMHFSGKWIFIRFNVNRFYDNKKRYRQTKFNNRLERLRQEITLQLQRITDEDNTQPLEIIKLFYDNFSYPRYTYTYNGKTHVKTLVPD